MSDDQATTPIQDSFNDNQDFFEIVGATDMSEEDKANVLLQLIEIVQTRVFDRIYDLLNQKQRDELTKYMEDEDVEQVELFMQQAVPDYVKMFEMEAKKLRREVVAAVVG